MFIQQLLQRRRVTRDDRVDRCLEVRDRRVATHDGFNVIGKRRPARKPVFARDEELHVGQHTFSGELVRVLELLPAAIDSSGFPLDLLTSLWCERHALQAAERLYPRRGPITYRAGFTAAARALKILGEPFVLIEVWVRGKRNGVGHTNLGALCVIIATCPSLGRRIL